MLARMKRICSQTGTTPFHFLMAAFRSFLFRYSDEEDITIHMADGSRPHPELEETIGFFVNLIPIRLNKKCDGAFDALLDHTKTSILEASKHNAVPFDEIVDTLKIEKSSSHFPLGQVILNYQSHGKMPRFKTQDFEIGDIENEDIPTAAELQLEALEDPEKGLDLRLEYSTTLYGSDDTERFFDNFLHYLRNVIKDHRQPIAEVEMCGAKELDHLKNNLWNTRTTANSWGEVLVADKVLEAASEHPDSIAVSQSDGQTITYSDLVSQAKKIAASLQQSGAGAGDIVGVIAAASIEAVLAMLGSLLAGCGYLAMDPEFAFDRLTFMAKDSKVRYMLADDLRLKNAAMPIANDDSFEPPHLLSISDARKCKHHLYPSKVSKKDPMYIVYTSVSIAFLNYGLILIQPGLDWQAEGRSAYSRQHATNAQHSPQGLQVQPERPLPPPIINLLRSVDCTDLVSPHLWRDCQCRIARAPEGSRRPRQVHVRFRSDRDIFHANTICAPARDGQVGPSKLQRLPNCLLRWRKMPSETG